MADPFRQHQFLTVLDRDEADRRFREHLDLSPLDPEPVPLAAALGRVVAADVAAPIDVPGFDRSNVDGFAVRAEDTFGASEDSPLSLAINAEMLAPGRVPVSVVEPGMATLVATGAMIPRGASAVVMVEHTDVRDGRLVLTRPAAPGANVTWAGTDIGRGETVLHRGSVLTSRETGVLAALGLDRVAVVRRPKVAILSTGDEVQPPGEPPRPGCVFDSNQTVLADAVRELGGEPVCCGIVPDDYARLREAFAEALAVADAVLLSGGTSKGAGDVSYRVVGEFGPPGVVAHGVALKPGKPLCLAVVNLTPRPPSLRGKGEQAGGEHGPESGAQPNPPAPFPTREGGAREALPQAMTAHTDGAGSSQPNPPTPFPKREGGENTLPPVEDGPVAGTSTPLAPPSLLGKGAGGLGFGTATLPGPEPAARTSAPLAPPSLSGKGAGGLGFRRPIPVAVLPGFPTSAVFTFHEFVAPVLRALAGRPPEGTQTVRAVLPQRVNSERGRTEYVLVGLVRNDGGLVAFPMGKGSGSVTAFGRADGFVTIPRQREYLDAGEEVEVRLLGAGLRPADLIVIGSHCVGLDLLLGELRNRGFSAKVLAVGSTAGLEAARRGECDLAPIHLLDPATNEYNRPFLAPGLDLITGYGRQQGIVFRRGDGRFEGKGAAEAVATAVADPGCVLANRNRGSGTRILLDQLLGGAKPAGFLSEAKTHSAVAAAVAQGRADWGLAIEPAAREYALGFTPVRDERYDFVVPAACRDRPAVRAFVEVLGEPGTRRALSGYGFSA
ncbi:MAG: substrate-binding domain-containing protein [Gemmataceae bacterium]